MSHPQNSRAKEVCRCLPHLDEDTSAILAMMLDPYHDVPIAMVSPGSIFPRRTLVRMRKASTVVSMPPTTAGTQALSVVMWPACVATKVTPTGWNYGEIQARTGAGAVYNPFVGGVSGIVADDASTNTFWTGYSQDLQVNGAPGGIGNEPEIFAISTSSAGATVAWKTGAAHAYQQVIGCAFEIHNTTNVLAVQGSLTAWQSNGADSVRRSIPVDNDVAAIADFGASDSPYCADATTGKGGFYPNTTLVPRPPLTLDEAQAIPDSVTWNAQDGLYMVPLPSRILDDPQLTNGNAFTLVGEFGGTENSPSRDCLADIIQVPNKARQLYHKQNLCGVQFEGLASGDTTFRITARWIVAEMPLIPDGDDLLIAQRCGRPIRHLEDILANVSRGLPVAVPVCENGNGDWWKKVKGVLSAIGKSMAPMLGPEIGPIVGLASGLLGALPSGKAATQAVNDAGPKKLVKLLKSGVLSRQQQLVATQRLLTMRPAGRSAQGPKHAHASMPGSGRTDFVRRGVVISATPPASSATQRARRRKR